MTPISGPNVVQSPSFTKGGKTPLVGKTSDIDLDDINRSIKAKGVRLKVDQRCSQLYIRGTFVQPDGSSKRQRIPLNLPNIPGSLLEAENRVIQFAALLQQKGIVPDPLPWKDRFDPEHTPTTLSVDNAISKLHLAFWKGKEGTDAQRRTWDRLNNDLKRLSHLSNAEITVDLLISVIEDQKLTRQAEIRNGNKNSSYIKEIRIGTDKGTKSRLDCCKTFKRLAKLAGLEDLERIDEIKGDYEPTIRQRPDEDQLIELVMNLRDHPKWGWATAALLIYGCRPAEVFSLIPSESGTAARVITLNKGKKKKGQPETRTAMALPAELADLLDINDIHKEYEFNSLKQYQSLEAKRHVDQWGGWFQRKSGAMALELYDVRHAWAVRAIRMNRPTGLAAACMGHSIKMHCDTYLSTMQEEDVLKAIKDFR